MKAIILLTAASTAMVAIAVADIAVPLQALQVQVVEPITGMLRIKDFSQRPQIVDRYRGKSRPTAALLENLDVDGVLSSSENIATLRQWLSEPGSSVDNIVSLRLLGSLFNWQLAPEQKMAIANDLRRYIAQAIAHGSHRAPVDAQIRLAHKLNERNNTVGSEVLALLYTEASAVATLTPDVAGLLSQYMQRHETVMPMAIGEVGIPHLVLYAEWLHTTALLAERSGQRAYARFVWDHLNDAQIDPRKLLGFLSAPPGRAFIAHEGNPAAFRRLAKRVDALARQFPDHPVLTPMSVELRKQLAASEQQGTARPAR